MKLTEEQAAQAIKFLQEINTDNCCSFYMSRKFEKGKQCKDENGRVFNCTNCSIEYFLKGLK